MSFSYVRENLVITSIFDSTYSLKIPNSEKYSNTYTEQIKWQIKFCTTKEIFM
jgi:hypothetical protein